MLRLARVPRLLSTTYAPSSALVVVPAARTMATRAPARPLHVAPTPEEESALLAAEIAEIEKWWKAPRWKGIKRTYSARDVATKRGTLKQTYPSSAMAKKLHSLLADKAAKGLPVHTSTCPRRRRSGPSADGRQWAQSTPCR